MPQDNGIMASIRRSGWAGSDAQTYQAQDDAKANGEVYMSHRLSEAQAHARADQSVQDHVQRQAGSTGGTGVEE